MKLASIHPGDLIEVDKRGRRMFGKVVEIEDALVRFEPLCPGVSYRHASSREIIGHWKKTGRRTSGRSSDQAPTAAREQLALGLESRR
jgi:hypothetical protein